VIQGDLEDLAAAQDPTGISGFAASFGDGGAVAAPGVGMLQEPDRRSTCLSCGRSNGIRCSSSPAGRPQVLALANFLASAPTSIMGSACAYMTEPEESSLLIVGRGSARVRFGHHGEIRGQPSQEHPSCRERLVRAVQRSTRADHDHDRLVRRSGEIHQAEVDVPLLPAGTSRAWTQSEQLD
jgi:hypothetical protein